jgi:hypothetical protein
MCLPRWLLLFFWHCADHSQLCLLLSEIDYNPLWMEFLLQLFSIFCVYKRYMYFIKSKLLKFFVFIRVLCIVYCVH